MKQTALEWFSDEISEIIGRIPLSQEKEEKLIQTLEKAKEMEKQQIFDAWNDGLYGSLRKGEDKAEQYYNEKFKNK